jgi:hypothetical protein
VKRFAVGILFVLVCAATSACASGAVAPRMLEQDEREVLLAVIRYMQTEEGGEPAPVLAALSMEITAEDDYLLPDEDALKEELEFMELQIHFPVEVFPDLLRRNRTRVPLARLIGGDVGVRWISEAQVDSVNAANTGGLNAEMQLLARMYPGARAMHWLSRPGFDEPRRHASVAYGGNCGDLCGTAGVYLLEYRDGRWRVIERLPMLVS